MYLLGLWLGSTALSYYMEFNWLLTLMKDVADEGYKFAGDEADKRSDGNRTLGEKLFVLIPFIPIINIMVALALNIRYLLNKAIILEDYKINGDLEQMSQWEREEYAKNPTKSNALFYMIYYRMKLKDSIVVTIEEANGTSKVWVDRFLLDKDNKADIHILKVTGPLIWYPEEERKKKVMENMDIVTRLNEMLSELSSDLENKLGDTEKSSNSEKIQELVKLREEVTGDKTATDNTEVIKGKKRTYTKGEK